MLDRDYTHPVRDPLWKHIYLSKPLVNIIRNYPFLKLAGLKQLGPTYLVYPGATHTRLNHSLGVFHIAKRIVRILVKSEECPELTEADVNAFLCAALFHDIGHFPHAHAFLGFPLKDHETLSGEIVRSDLRRFFSDEVGTDPEMVAAIVDHEIDIKGHPVIRFFRNILSGVLDPDKLDYLNRDAYFCGVPYGTQDTDFVVSQLLPHKHMGLALSKKGLSAVEHLLFSKYLMYKNVYWHKTVRMITAMITKSIYLGLSDTIITPEDLYYLEDAHFQHKFTDHSYKPFQLIKDAEAPVDYRILWSEPFREGDSLHVSLMDLGYRRKFEEQLAARLKTETGIDVDPMRVIIDIPGNISFEVDLPIVSKDREKDFTDSGTVFDTDVVNKLTQGLRKIHIIVPARVAEAVKHPEELLNWIS